MTAQQNLFLILKLAIVGIFMLGVFVLTGMGKVDATAALAAITTGIGTLVVALGISGSGASQAAAMRAAAGVEPPSKGGSLPPSSRVASVDRADKITRPVDVPNVPKSNPPPKSLRVPTALLGAACACACAGGALMACLTPKTVADITVGLDAAVCVLDTYSADLSAGQSEAQAVADAVIKCGVSTAQASGILASHKHAETMEAKAVSQ